MGTAGELRSKDERSGSPQYPRLGDGPGFGGGLLGRGRRGVEKVRKITLGFLLLRARVSMPCVDFWNDMVDWYDCETRKLQWI